MSNQRNTNNRNNQQRKNRNTNEEGFFSWKSTGLGYVNNLEERQNQTTGDLFTVCTIAVLVGPKNTEKRQYRYVDVTVVGQKTIDLIWQYEQDLIDKRNVLIKFCMSDIEASAYQRQNGELGVSLKSYLYAIGKIWVDNEVTYETNAEDSPNQGGNRSSNQQQRQSTSDRSNHTYQDKGYGGHQGGNNIPRNARQGQTRSSAQKPRTTSRQ